MSVETEEEVKKGSYVVVRGHLYANPPMRNAS